MIKDDDVNFECEMELIKTVADSQIEFDE